jgi:hypothetical protein
LPTRLVFGPNQPVARGERSGVDPPGTPDVPAASGSRADAITVVDDIDEVVRQLREAPGGWARFDMQSGPHTSRAIYVNAQAVRFIRAA